MDNLIRSLDYALRLYNSAKYSNLYAIGFLYDGFIYVHVGKTLPRNSLYMDSGNIRLDLRKSTIDKWLRSPHTYRVCSEVELQGLIDDSINCHSYGECLERLLTEKVGQIWYKDYVPFYKGCDIEHLNYRISVKYGHKATIARQKSLQRIARGEI